MSLCMGCMKEKGDAESCPHCGYTPGIEEESPLYLKSGAVLNGRYLIGRVLGQGGFGITYIGFDQVLNTRVAIKEYYPGDLAQRTPGDTTVMPYTGQARDDFGAGRAKFVEEARTLAKFSDFPGIVSVKDCFEANGTAYLVMQYLEGISLKEYLDQKGGTLPPDQAVAILTPVMDALKEVHKSGIIHRDISPDNIFITTEGQVKLIDFGAARQSLGSQSRSLSVMLKPGYAPEEQYRSRGNQGPWTDVYALSATLYRMVTGSVPPDSLERLSDDTLEIPPSLPETLRVALQIGLAVRAPERYATVGQLQGALEGQWQPAAPIPEPAADPVSAAQTTLQPASQPPRRLWPVFLISGVVLVCALCIAAVFLASGRLKGPAEQPAAFTATASPEPTATAAPAPTQGVSMDENGNLVDGDGTIIMTAEDLAAQQASAGTAPATSRPAPPPVQTPKPAPTPYDHSVDEEILEQVALNSTYGFIDSVNTGDFSYMAPYLDSSSSYYSEQKKAVASIHGRGVTESLNSCSVTGIQWVDNNSCKLTQHTSITCFYPDGTSKNVVETYTYLMKRSGGTFLYAKMYE